MEFSRILVRAPNWLGDAVMSIPALRAIRERFAGARLTILARSWVADLYAREPFCDEVLIYPDSGARAKWHTIRDLKSHGFDCAILLQNAFEAALVAWLARIPRRIGYSRDARAPLLTDRIPVPKKGEIHAHERYYYLELLRRAGMIDRMPDAVTISLAGAGEARATGLVRLHAVGLPERVIGISPGAANSRAKQWGPERFAEAAHTLAGSPEVGIALFGSAGERELCEAMRAQLSRFHPTVNFAGRTRLAEFIETAAACHVFLTNDSGAMHVAAAVGTPTVAVFGPTDAVATGPSGPRCRVVREPVSCSPCLLRDCPIDHRCMTRVTTASVVEAARDLVGCTAQFRKVT